MAGKEGSIPEFFPGGTTLWDLGQQPQDALCFSHRLPLKRTWGAGVLQHGIMAAEV